MFPRHVSTVAQNGQTSRDAFSREIKPLPLHIVVVSTCRGDGQAAALLSIEPSFGQYFYTIDKVACSKQ